MHPINLGLIFVAGLNAGLALLIWLRNPKHKINITFASSVLFLATWTLGMAMFRGAKDEVAAWLWTWVQNGSGGLVVIPFYLFSIYYPYQRKRMHYWQWGFVVFTIILMFFNVVIPGVWVKNIELKPSGNIYALNRLGIGYFAIHFYIYLILAFYNLFNKYKESDNFIKKQLLQLILFASIISFFGGFFSVLIPLILLDLGPYWVGPYFSLPLIFYLSWFIFKKN